VNLQLGGNNGDINIWYPLTTATITATNGYPIILRNFNISSFSLLLSALCLHTSSFSLQPSAFSPAHNSFRRGG